MADQELQTLQLREFKGANLTDTRTSIQDNEWAFLENAIPIGSGNLQLVPGSGTVVGTVAAGIASLWGVTMTFQGLSSALLISVNNDGSMSMIDPVNKFASTIAIAGTVTTAARLTMWKSSPVLIIDPTKGYFQYEGTAFKTTSTTVFGTDIATFEGRAWIVQASGGLPTRTILFTAPDGGASSLTDAWTDFNAAHGAGSTTITDSAFAGPVRRIFSALEQLWVVGAGAVEAISNVQTASGITTFSTTNIVSNVGSLLPSSVSSFFRTFLFLAPYGVYAIVGATPQKLSDKLDGLFPLLTLGADAPAAVATVNNVFIWCVLVPYADPNLTAGGTRDILLCFSQGKWFFASVASTPTLTGMASVLISGQPDLFVTDGTNVFQMFADSTASVNYTIQSKLFDFGDSTQMKAMVRFGLEVQSDSLVQPLVLLENENPADALAVNLVNQNTITFVNNANVPIIFVGAGPITWVVTGLQLIRNAQAVQMRGQYLGYTIEGLDPTFRLSAVVMQVKPEGKWVNLRGGV